MLTYFKLSLLIVIYIFILCELLFYFCLFLPDFFVSKNPQQIIIIFNKDFIYLYLERGEGREKERQRYINVWLLLTWPLLGTWPTTQACALPGNWTGGPLVHSMLSIHWAAPAKATNYFYWSYQFWFCSFLFHLFTFFSYFFSFPYISWIYSFLKLISLHAPVIYFQLFMFSVSWIFG